MKHRAASGVCCDNRLLATGCSMTMVSWGGGRGWTARSTEGGTGEYMSSQDGGKDPQCYCYSIVTSNLRVHHSDSMAVMGDYSLPCLLPAHKIGIISAASAQKQLGCQHNVSVVCRRTVRSCSRWWMWW